ncbi:class I adenylate-forming enzyme family protein [Sphingopyxis yananensis]|uniref:class I adenylate-forming enzyme family protein n=1 Tax=Sphingopyxis yananensis TaxID=2886687 RepID=UPI001D11775D|nr:AMP-binding protein [Sphingopyxis yananensis]MCC2602390.1 AMP-binding protein [Sphingopyxis yananensis]
MSFTVASALNWWAREIPDNVALSVDDDAVSYAQIHDWSARVGHHLLNNGVRSGDRVMIVSLNSLPYAVLILALAKIGAIGTPLTFRSSPLEIAEAIENFEPSFLFTDAEREAVAIEGLGDRGTTILRSLDDISALRHGARQDLPLMADENAPMFVIATSGSTAKSKGVIQTQRGVMTYACEFAVMEPRCGKGARFLSLGPFSSQSGYLLFLQFLATGVSIYMETKFEPERALRLLVEKQISMFLAVPIFFERIAALPSFADADLSNLYFGQIAGARVKVSLLKLWRDKGVILRQAYGCTEAGGGWAARDDTAVVAPEKCGRGGLFNEFAIAGEDGQLAPPGTVGEILFRGSSLMGGYWNNPEATADALKDGWFHTGDLGQVDEIGNVTFVDRLKDIIISGGLNISAAEIEKVIAEIDGVEEVAVIAANDDAFGETPMAVIYGETAKLSIADIIAHCDRALASYKVPRYVTLEDEPLPRLPSGKISKPALRALYQDASARLQRVR